MSRLPAAILDAIVQEFICCYCCANEAVGPADRRIAPVETERAQKADRTKREAAQSAAAKLVLIAMSGNKYTRTVNQLESELAAKLAEVKLLQDENSRLRARDRALTTFTGGVDSGSGVESSLLASTTGSSAALAACSGDGSTAPLQPSDDTAKRIAAIERQVQALLGQIGPGTSRNNSHNIINALFLQLCGLAGR